MTAHGVCLGLVLVGASTNSNSVTRIEQMPRRYADTADEAH